MFVRTKIRANQCSGCGGAVDPTEILDLVAKGKSVREDVAAAQFCVIYVLRFFLLKFRFEKSNSIRRKLLKGVCICISSYWSKVSLVSCSSGR